MAYTKQTWVDGTTPIDAEHLNHMEDGIEAASSGQSAPMFLSVDEPITDVDSVIDAFENGTIIIGIHRRAEANKEYIDTSLSVGVNLLAKTISVDFVDYDSDSDAWGIRSYWYTGGWQSTFNPFVS